jgi:hypothetical protein
MMMFPAAPYEVDRMPQDQFQRGGFPNYHYVRFEVLADRVVGEMIRLADQPAPVNETWQASDRFEVSLRP